MDDLVLQSERLAMQIDRDLEMPRIKRNLSQILNAGNQLWNRTVDTSANRDASEVRASVLLGARGYDYQKVSRNLNNLVAKAVRRTRSTHQNTQMLHESDIKGFVKSERESATIKIIEETKSMIKDMVQDLYWERVESSWRKDKLDLLDTISVSDSVTTPATSNIRRPPTLVETTESIEKAAEESYDNGQFEEAVKLYDSISKYDKVLQILTMLLSEVLPGDNATNPERAKLEDLALKIANRYCEPQVDLPREIAGTFYLLLDLMTFFDYYHSHQYNEALDTIHKLKILPQSQAEAEAKSREFNRYPEEIRRNISDILMATMNILYTTYKEQPSIDIKQKATALITFSGLIQYRLPSDTIARIIELEVLI